jgi:lipopolysaccharide export system protein LptA
MYCHKLCAALAALVLLPAAPTLALQSDRQQPLEVNADTTDGTLGDGVTVLRGHVEIQQGSLHIKADEAEVEKLDGKVRLVTLREGLVQAEARVITYQVGPGVVTLEGEADVRHPQYEISGDHLTYDLTAQHFQGTGDDSGNGRIRIRLDPELAEEPEESAEPDESD